MTYWRCETVRTQHVGIFGYPLGHSISPAFQQAALDYHGVPATYHAWPVPPDRLADEVARLRGVDYLGANVTVPHKEHVREYLDEIDPWAQSIGAVNTIVREGSRLVGYNTDAYGFIKSLNKVGGFDPDGKRVVILGAGGAARAAVFGLAEEGISSLTIANRTLQRAQSLADEVSGSIAAVEAISVSGPSLADACADAQLIVNCTSIGMRHSETEGSTPLDANLIPAGSLVYDMVYNPPRTPLLLAAAQAGANAVGGLSMLIYQGAAAFEHWTGKEAPIEVMFRAGEQALASTFP